MTEGSDDVLHETHGETAETAAGTTTDEPVGAARVDEAAAPELAHEPVAAAEPPTLDLGRIEHDLAGVEAALRRLDDGSYWTDEITGEPLDDALLFADPVARRNH